MVVLTVSLVTIPTSGGQEDRLEDDVPAAANSSTNSTRSGGFVVPLVCIEDKVLYGICTPDNGTHRLGTKFKVYVTPLGNSSIRYSILVDEKPQRLANGKTSRIANETVNETFDLPVLRRAKLKVHVTDVSSNKSVTLYYGQFRFMTAKELRQGTVDKLVERVQEEIFTFTQAQLTWAFAKAVVPVAATVMGFLAIGWLWALRQYETAGVSVIAE